MLEPVVITGAPSARRLAEAPYAVTAIDTEALRAAGPMVNLSEALVRVPGLVVNQRNNYAQDLQVSARGFGARAGFGVRGLRLVSDGIPATMPDGQGQVAHFDLAGAQRVEVLRGPFSALYGNSSGGVIAVFSQPVTAPRFEAALDAGSDHLRQQRLAWSAPLGQGFDLALSGTSFSTDGPRPHSAATRQLANLRLGWQGTADRVVWLLSNQDQQADDPLGLDRTQFNQNPGQTSPLATQYDTRKTVRQTQTGVSWTHDFAGVGALKQSRLSAYAGSRGVMQVLPISPTVQANPTHSGGVVDFDRLYQGLDGRLTWRWTSAELVAGLNTEQQRDQRRGHENFIGSGPAQVLGVQGAPRRDEINTATTREAYAQGEWQLAPAWALTLGARTGRVHLQTDDHYLANGDDSGTLTYRYTTPVLGLRWRASSGLTLHASVARGFESPTLGELAYRPDGLGGFNTALQPQTSRQAELGAKWRAGRDVAVDGVLFLIDTRNEIGVQSNSGGRATFQNVGGTRRYGAEANGNWRFTPTWRAEASLGWLSARYRNDFLTCAGTPCTLPSVAVPAGRRIAGTQAFSSWAALAWRPGVGDAETALEWRTMGRTAVNDVNSDFAPGCGVLGLRWRQRWRIGNTGDAATDGRLELLARLDNLAGQRHAGSVIVNEGNGRYFEPAAGRTALVSLRYLRGL